jgi:hypothetical protein
VFFVSFVRNSKKLINWCRRATITKKGINNAT